MKNIKKINKKIKIFNFRNIVLISLLILGFVYIQIFLSPSSFPVDKSFIVKKGDLESDIYNRLAAEKFIRSAYFARVFSKLFQDNNIQIGEYNFGQKLSLWQMLISLRIKPKAISITVPEGYTKSQIAQRIVDNGRIKNFSQTEFLLRAKEGYLFPETYYFYSFTDTSQVLEDMQNEWTDQMVKTFGRLPTESEVIIASILEREARNFNDMKLISGIIQNRLRVGMNLQIDATVLYGAGIWKDKTTLKDLEYLSAYNTYKNKGLPQGPISNPGLNSMRAAINPAKTNYMFYLTGRDGQMYYAVTGAQHLANKRNYINQ